MKAILMSIRPQWCEKIFNGEKTIEVRKTAPTTIIRLFEPPFTVYVYETKAQFVKSVRGACTTYGYGRGKVIGSFVCDTFVIDKTYGRDALFNGAACLTQEEAEKYSHGNILRGWHITEPKLFDKPKDITEFALYGKCAEDCEEYDICARDIAEDRVTCKYFKRTFLKRPPQSWCYVEEME